MHDDTPPATPDDSQVPPSPTRKEETLADVAPGVDPTETPDIENSEDPSAPPVPAFAYDGPPQPVTARADQRAPERSSNTALFLLSVIVAGIFGSVVTIGALAATGTFDRPEAAAPPPIIVDTTQPTQPVETLPSPVIISNLGTAVNPTAVAFKAVPSIVTVTVFEAPADDESQPIPVGSGSGVVISTDGYIVTNHHVIEDADTFSVTFEDGRVYEATLVGSDDHTDLAVLWINATALVPVEFGTSSSLKIGDPAIAIGNPLGQEGGASVTVGIISAFDRRVDFADNSFLHGMIQTDAAINSGSSGGALFDAAGRLIGITSAIGVSQAGPEGIGYAIPIELVERITAEIIDTGDVVHPFLGVSIATHTEVSDDGAITPAGAIIHTIEGENSAAGIAGLLPGDVVTRIGTRDIRDQTDLILAVRLYRVGDEVEFTATREGEEFTFSVVMGERPAEFGG
ncbi:MAG: trypsin-like peptidase domain-containing protein [Actinomycetota bacterium]|nr:trypsin-like peptidase domain-containing protein [Actinomycetota bacterium]